MYHALVTLQKRNIEALQIGEGRGLSTREMAEHLERESGMLDLYEALEAIVTGERGPLLLGEPEMIERMERGRLRMEKARAALGKARGESNAKRNG